MRGFSPAAALAQRKREVQLRAATRADRVGQWMGALAAEPHHAGTEGSRKVAQYLLQSLRKWGWRTDFEVYEVLLPFPRERRLQMLSPEPFTASLKEPAIDQDADSSDTGQLPTFNAYAGSGDVTAPLIYVNYGTPEDYDELERMGESVRGKIVIARYGRSWRGIKPKLAQERGALGCLIFSDPADDGYGKGAAYPEGPYRPPLGVQRGSVMDMPVYPGDPTTPGTPSLPGAKRLPVHEAETILKIPVLPLSHADARPLLENMGGKPAPRGWQGGLSVPYRIGAGEVRVRMQVEHSFEIRKLYNVVATLPGKRFPDEWVLYGNHHDAWVNGAHDPVSGAAVVLEVGRVLGEAHKAGWRPDRTIKLCLWDGEEFGIIGSTEWVEHHLPELRNKLVAYFNSDSNGRGQIRVGGSQHLGEFMRQVLQDVNDPAGGGSVLDARVRLQNSLDGENRPFRIEAAGSGSDYAPFLHHATMPALNLGFGGGCPGAGVYHSIYDTLRWYEKYCDPGHRYGKLLAEVMVTALSRLAAAPVIPYEFNELAGMIDQYREEVQQLARETGVSLNLAGLQRSTQRLRDESAAWNAWLASVASREVPDDVLASINGRLLRAEAQLALKGGLPGRPWYRHPIYAPGLFTGYGVKTLPGIRESIETGETAVATIHADLAAGAVNRMADHLRATRLSASTLTGEESAANAIPPRRRPEASAKPER